MSKYNHSIESSPVYDVSSSLRLFSSGENGADKPRLYPAHVSTHVQAAAKISQTLAAEMQMVVCDINEKCSVCSIPT